MMRLAKEQNQAGAGFVMGKEPALLPGAAAERVRPRPHRPVPWLGLAVAGSAALAAWCAAGGADGQAPELRISVAPTIVAGPESVIAFPIQIGPPEALPKKSFLSVRGLPPSVSLTEGHPVAPGSWAIPFSGLPTLKASIPAGIYGRSEIVISLIAMDGKMLIQAHTVLIVEPSAAGSREAAPPQPRLDFPEDRVRAERALAQGEEYFARGSILIARQFFQRAADAGLAAAALRLAATYDPVELQRINASGVVPDLDLARRWYQRARDLGASEAEGRLARLGGR